MQNYAKFESKVAEDQMLSNSIPYWKWFSSNNNIFDYIYRTIDNLIDLLLAVTFWFFVIFWLFLFIYVIVSLFTKGWENTNKELKKLLLWTTWSIKIFFTSVFKYIKNFVLFFWNRKILSIMIIIFITCFNFWTNIINWNSKILKLDKINTGYVWVDLKNNEVFNPGYHLYSPIKTSYFLSPTSNFNFSIIEVTANTSEDLWVSIDYNVDFKLIEEERLDFYNTYWVKSIKQVSSEVVMPRLLEVIKWIIKEYWFKDISSKHNEIKTITLEKANKVLIPMWIKLQDITIQDIRLPESYLTSKENLLKAENELKLAEARLEAQKKESEKRVAEAESAKKVKIIEAEAIAEYNKIISEETINDDAIEMKKLEIERFKIEKWDWKLPTSIEWNLDL